MLSFGFLQLKIKHFFKKQDAIISVIFIATLVAFGSSNRVLCIDSNIASDGSSLGLLHNHHTSLGCLECIDVSLDFRHVMLTKQRLNLNYLDPVKLEIFHFSSTQFAVLKARIKDYLLKKLPSQALSFIITVVLLH